MPRAARIAPNEQIYHILTRGNNRQDVFKNEKDYYQYIAILQKYKERYKFRLYHYVLMRNHIHLVLETTEKGGSIAQTMKGINLSYAQYYKNENRHIGHFWQDRYKSIIISKDNYLLACGSYVELNPVRAKIVEDPKKYKWSSYNHYAYDKTDKLLDEHPIYQDIAKEPDERQTKYREFLNGMLKDKKAMKGEMDRKTVYGSEGFTKEAEKKYKISANIKSVGRPKKEAGEDENR